MSPSSVVYEIRPTPIMFELPNYYDACYPACGRYIWTGSPTEVPWVLCYTWPTIGYKWVAIPMHYHSRYQLNPYHHRAYPRRANATSFSVCCYSHVKLLHLIYTAVETPTDLRYILRNARGRGTGYSLRTSAFQVYGTLLHEESRRYSQQTLDLVEASALQDMHGRRDLP